MPVTTSSPYNSLTNSFSSVQGGVHAGPGRCCRNRFSGSERVYFPLRLGACCCQAGWPAIGWEEGSNLNCLLYLPNQGSRLIAGSEQRYLGGVRHLCLSFCLLGAAARGFFLGQNRASRSPPPSH